MNPDFLMNKALLTLQALIPYLPLQNFRNLWFRKGMSWSCDTEGSPQILFPLTGLMVLEDPRGSVPVPLALLGRDVAIPLCEEGGLLARALTDVRAVSVPVAEVMTVSPTLLLRWQERLMHRMSDWMYCVNHHTPEQSLADGLLWAHRSWEGADLAKALDALPGGQRLTGATRQALIDQWVAAGALRQNGAALVVLDGELLAPMACGCHSTGPALQPL